jgi:hypothetical protein
LAPSKMRKPDLRMMDRYIDTGRRQYAVSDLMTDAGLHVEDARVVLAVNAMSD